MGKNRPVLLISSLSALRVTPGLHRHGQVFGVDAQHLFMRLTSMLMPLHGQQMPPRATTPR